MRLPKAILFDLDDTLTDRGRGTARYTERLRCEFASALRPTPPDALLAAVKAADRNGYNPQRARDLAHDLPWRESPGETVLARHWDRHYVDCAVARSGAAATLRRLRRLGVAVGLVTNGEGPVQRAKLARLRLRLDCTAISGELGVAKPDPAIFARALDDLGCGADEAWFVGDHPRNDVGGASAAGIAAFWLAGGTPWPEDDPPPNRIATLPELADAIRPPESASDRLRIHVFGASGAGTTTLARVLARRLGLVHLDSDDFYWLPTDPPYTVPRPTERRIAMLERALRGPRRWVLSGSLCGWGDPLIPRFDLVIFVATAAEQRLAWLRARERARYGEFAIAAGGRLHAAHRDFLEWAAAYDDGPPHMRSRARHEAWLSGVSAEVIRLEDAASVEARAAAVVERLRALGHA